MIGVPYSSMSAFDTQRLSLFVSRVGGSGRHLRIIDISQRMLLLLFDGRSSETSYQRRSRLISYLCLLRIYRQRLISIAMEERILRMGSLLLTIRALVLS